MPDQRRTSATRSSCPAIAERTAQLVDVFSGARELAGVLGVSSADLSLWAAGARRPTLEQAQALLALDFVMANACLVWSPTVATTWLESSNAFLEGATPLQVLRRRGPGDVVTAIRDACV